jgi:hypothetical protein
LRARWHWGSPWVAGRTRWSAVGLMLPVGAGATGCVWCLQPITGFRREQGGRVSSPSVDGNGLPSWSGTRPATSRSLPARVCCLLPRTNLAAHDADGHLLGSAACHHLEGHLCASLQILCSVDDRGRPPCQTEAGEGRESQKRVESTRVLQRVTVRSSYACQLLVPHQSSLLIFD